jgi:hypothetical protein
MMLEEGFVPERHYLTAGRRLSSNVIDLRGVKGPAIMHRRSVMAPGLGSVMRGARVKMKPKPEPGAYTKMKALQRYTKHIRPSK